MPIISPAQFTAYLQAFSGITLTASAELVLGMLQPMVEAQIHQVLGWTVAQNTFTEYYPETPVNGYIDVDDNLTGWDIQGGLAVALIRPNRGLSVLQMRNIPVRSITACYENIGAWLGGTENGDFSDADLLPAASYYIDQSRDNWAWSGQLIRTNGAWSSIVRTVKVVYVAGLTPQEIATNYSGIQMATLITLADTLIKAVARSRAAQFGAFPTSVSMEDVSLGFSLLPVLDGSQGTSIPAEAMAWLSRYINLSRYLGR